MVLRCCGGPRTTPAPGPSTSFSNTSVPRADARRRSRGHRAAAQLRKQTTHRHVAVADRPHAGPRKMADVIAWVEGMFRCDRTHVCDRRGTFRSVARDAAQHAGKLQRARDGGTWALMPHPTAAGRPSQCGCRGGERWAARRCSGPHRRASRGTTPRRHPSLPPGDCCWGGHLQTGSAFGGCQGSGGGGVQGAGHDRSRHRERPKRLRLFSVHSQSHDQPISDVRTGVKTRWLAAAASDPDSVVHSPV